MIDDLLQSLMTMAAFLFLFIIAFLAAYGFTQLPLFQCRMRQRSHRNISIYENALIRTTQPYVDYINELAQAGFTPSCEDFQDYLRARQLPCGWYYVSTPPAPSENTEEIIVVYRREEEQG